MSRPLLFILPVLLCTVYYSLHARSLSSPQIHFFQPARPFSRRIVAVGDLHGDLPNAKQVLQMADVVDANGDWSGAVDVFVQTGDIIDRGDDTIALFAYMDELREQAHAHGQAVLSHLGNHEWMNVIGDWRYVRPSEIATFGSVSDREHALSSKGFLGRAWAANYTTASRLPLHPILGPPNTPYPPSSPDPSTASALSHAALSFVHGGLAPSFPHLTPFPTAINALSRTLLTRLHSRPSFPPPHPPNPYPGLPEGTTEAERRFMGNDGPLWHRGWALDDESVVCREVDDILEKTGTRRMVMGHTPDFERIVSRCGGKIIIIDTGISHAYGGVLSALSVEYTLSPLLSRAGPSQSLVSYLSSFSPFALPSAENRNEEQRWAEHEVIRAIYHGDRPAEMLVDEEREVVGPFAGWH